MFWTGKIFTSSTAIPDNADKKKEYIAALES